MRARALKRYLSQTSLNDLARLMITRMVLAFILYRGRMSCSSAAGKDAGAHDDITVQFYDWRPESQTWTKHLISTAPAGEGPGIGLQIRIHDLDGNGWKDIIVPGKSGTHIIWNDGK